MDYRRPRRALHAGAAIMAKTMVLAGLGVGLTGLVLMSPTVAPEADAVVTPKAPTVAFAEDFENGWGTPGTPKYIDMIDGATYPYAEVGDMTGAQEYVSATRMTYTAAPYYSQGSHCDGIVLSYNDGSITPRNDGGAPAWATTSPAQTNKCSADVGHQSYNGIRSLARAMGQYLGTGDDNHMVSSYTECFQNPDGTQAGDCLLLVGYNPIDPNESIMFRAAPITVVPNHYYTFSVDAVAANCRDDASDPQYQFQLLDGDDLATVTDVGAALNPCADAAAKTYTVDRPQTVADQSTMTAKVASMTANQAFFHASSSLGLTMYNRSIFMGGNDGGFDNLKLMDVTPNLDISFAPAVVKVGGVATATWTITNTSDLLAKADWGFTTTLPPTMSLVGAATTTCTSVTGAALALTGAKGAMSISLTGADFATGTTGCTITATVSATTEMTYTPTVTNPIGVVPDTVATLTVANPRITLDAALGSARVVPADQFTVAIRTGSATGTIVNATTHSTTTGTGATVTAGSGTTGAYTASDTVTYYLTQAGSSGTDLSHYTTTLTCTDATDATTGLPTNAAFSGSYALTPAPGAAITCTLTNTAMPPTVTLSKALGGTRVVVGDQFAVSIRAGSPTGPVVSTTTNATTTGSGSTISAGTGTTGATTVTAGSPYYLTEAGAANLSQGGAVTSLAPYVPTISCTDSAGLQLGLPPAGTPLGTGLAVAPVAAARITCTITNTPTFDIYLYVAGRNPMGVLGPLDGSTWQVYAYDAGNVGQALDMIVDPVTGQRGLFIMRGLTPGSYWIAETTAPEGYDLLAAPVAFVVSPTGALSLPGSSDGIASVGTGPGGGPQLNILDEAELVLPLTGGPGTTVFIVVGTTIIGLALIGAAIGLSARASARRGRRGKSRWGNFTPRPHRTQQQERRSQA